MASSKTEPRQKTWTELLGRILPGDHVDGKRIVRPAGKHGLRHQVLWTFETEAQAREAFHWWWWGPTTPYPTSAIHSTGPILGPGYAHELPPGHYWLTAPDDMWDLVVAGETDVSQARHVGQRKIDGFLCDVFMAPGPRHLAQLIGYGRRAARQAARKGGSS